MVNALDKRNRIESLTDGQECYISLGEGAGAEVHRINGYYFLFEIPQYGGYPRFSLVVKCTESGIDDIIAAINIWT